MRRRTVKTHTFRNGKYHICEEDRILGVCDVPGGNQLTLTCLTGTNLTALVSALHEAMHAEGVPDELLDAPGNDSAERIAKFLMRMGWHR